MAKRVKVEGLRELERNLRQLEKHTARKAVARRVLKKNGQPLADEMNRLAPDDPSTTGGLNQSYAVSTRLNKSNRRAIRKLGKSDVEIHVGTDDPAGVQQEFGNVRHGAQPHARPAWDKMKRGILNGIVRDMGDEIDKAVKRQNGRKAK